MSARDELLMAAKKVQALAAEATDGPWLDLPMGSDGSVVLAGEPHILTARRPARCAEFADARWIALMSPAVAEFLVARLEHAANYLERYAEEGLYPFDALNLARYINRAVTT